jgi:hypothetical protein
MLEGLFFYLLGVFSIIAIELTILNELILEPIRSFLEKLTQTL